MTRATAGSVRDLDRDPESLHGVSTTISGRGRQLILTTRVAGVVMVIAAANRALVYIFSSNGLDRLVSFLPIMATGAVPYLVTAGLMALFVARVGPAPRDLAVLVIGVAVVGVPFIVVCTFWAAFGASSSS